MELPKFEEEREKISKDVQNYNTQNTAITSVYDEKIKNLIKEKKDVDVELNNYNPIEKTKKEVDKYIEDGNIIQYGIGKMAKLGLGIEQVAANIASVPYGTVEEGIEDVNKYGLKNTLLGFTNLGFTIDDENIKKGLTGNKYGIGGGWGNSQFAKNFYDWDSEESTRSTFSENVDTKAIEGVVDTALILGSGGVLGGTAKTLSRGLLKQGAKGATKAYAWTEAIKATTAGGAALIDSASPGDKNWAYELLIKQPGKGDKYMQAGKRSENTEISKTGPLRSFAVTSVPTANLLWGDKTAFEQGVIKAAIKDGYTEIEAEEIAKALAVQRVGSEVGRGTGIFLANVLSENIGRTKYIKLGKVDKPFRQSFSAVWGCRSV